MPQANPISVLKKRSDFTSVAAVRKRFVTSGFVVQAAPRLHKDSQTIGYGLTASKKMVSLLAVDRNRARRRLRALVREVFPAHARADMDYVLLAKKEMLALPYATLRADLEKALKRLSTQLADSTKKAIEA